MLGRRSEYEQLCSQMITEYADAEDTRGTYLAARAASLGSEPVVDAEQLAAMALRAVESEPNAGRRHTLGLCLLRQGKLEQSIACLNQALDDTARDSPRTWLALAIAHAKAGQEQEAQEWFARFQVWVERHPLDATRELQPPNRIECQLLWREAERLFAGDAAAGTTAGNSRQ
jgi:tetratricopeptide (TPR) repeat protein